VNLVLHHGQVVIAWPEAPVRGLDLDAGVSIGNVTRGVVRRLRWDEGPYHTRHLEMMGSVEHGDTVRIHLDRLRTDDLALKGDAAWSRAGWNVGGAVQRGDPGRWSAIGVNGWPMGDVAGTFRYAVDTRRHSAAAQLAATLAPSELAGWRADQGTVAVGFPGSG